MARRYFLMCVLFVLMNPSAQGCDSPDSSSTYNYGIYQWSQFVQAWVLLEEGYNPQAPYVQYQPGDILLPESVFTGGGSGGGGGHQVQGIGASKKPIGNQTVSSGCTRLPTMIVTAAPMASAGFLMSVFRTIPNGGGRRWQSRWCR